MKITETTRIIRENNDVKAIQGVKLPNLSKGYKEIMIVDENDGNFWMNSQYIIENHYKNSSETDGLSDTSIWYVVKSLKSNKENKTYKLSENDYLKLGRVRFKVRELGLSEEKKITSFAKLKGDSTGQIVDGAIEGSLSFIQGSKEKDGMSNIICRICLSETIEADNPFVSPCSCSGTMKFIHIKCLQKWLKSKLHMKTTTIAYSFVWKSFDCELCKKPFPNQILVDDQSFDVVEIPKFKPPYIVLEILSRDRNQCKGMHVINLSNKKSVRLGRGHDSDIRITDISVSRCHALLKFEKGNVYIEDNESKFGTLVLMKEPSYLNLRANSFAVQVGRTVLNLVIKKPMRSFISINLGKKGDGIIQNQYDYDFARNKYSSMLTNVEGESPINNRNDSNELISEENPPENESSVLN